ncbi:MAG: MCE family protein [Mycobacteriaceae bacterium]|nr:MCE family protein [Mycobacteriaceae bacterium]
MTDRRIRLGVIGITGAVALVLASLQAPKLPFVSATFTYQADFEDAGGLMAGDDVEVAGVKVGEVQAISLRDDHVQVRFTLPPRIQLGDASTAKIKTVTLLGRRDLTVVPTGAGRLDPGATIPRTRTTSPYSLNDALGDLSTTVKDLDTGQLNKALETLSDTLTDTPAPLRATLDGVGALSRSLNDRDEALRSLLAKAQAVTKVLGQRAGQVNSLLVDGNALLGELDARRTSITSLIANIRAVAVQLQGFVRDNQKQLEPALEQLNGVLTMLQNNEKAIKTAMDGLVGYATTLGEQVGSGPFFGAYVSNWGFNNYFQMVVDAMAWPAHLPADLNHYLTDPPLSFLPPTGAPPTPKPAPKPAAVPNKPEGPRR